MKQITKTISNDLILNVFHNEILIYKRFLNENQFEIIDNKKYLDYKNSPYATLKINAKPEFLKLKVSIRFNTKEEGGRSTCIFPKYRPNHVFEYDKDGNFKNAFMGEIRFNHSNYLELGKNYEVEVLFLLNQKLEEFLDLGREWWIHEGPIQVGKARILKFLK